MFHHFHGLNHPKRQGSLGCVQFEEMIDWLKNNLNLLSADEYQEKALLQRLEHGDICLSFDDALLCQYDLAVPILRKHGIKAFFFIYSSPMMGEADKLEIYSYFRAARYRSVDEFYNDFFQECKKLLGEQFLESRRGFIELDYLSEFPFYSDNDKWFRFVRDRVLQRDTYGLIMDTLMKGKGFILETILERLWINNRQLCDLAEQGHVLGLHSYTHPTVMASLPRKQQREEYEKNLGHLASILGSHDKVKAMSHPCGSYNEDTLDILRDLGIEIGFRSNMSGVENLTSLELPREDHANIARKIGL